MSVDPLGLPAKSFELWLKVAQAADIVHPGVGLELVVIDDDRQLVEAFMNRRLQGLPELPFLELAVSREDKHAPLFSLEPVRQDHAACLGDPHSEGARVGGNVRRADIGMPGKAVEPPELMNPAELEEPQAQEHAVAAGDIVAFRGEVNVPKLAAPCLSSRACLSRRASLGPHAV